MSKPSALFVTTVASTLEAFLVPFARHFRADGWRVDALANGASDNSAIADDFDHRFDATWGRRPLSWGNVSAVGQVREVVVDGAYDAVHVHTPIAAFVTRWALRSARRRPGGPAVVYTAHGFHFFAGGSAVSNAVYRAFERAAARWTDYLIVLTEEDLVAARAFGTIAPDRVRLIPGIGVDPAPYAPGAIATEAARAVRDEFRITEDGLMLTMIGEFAPVKRHAHVLDAIALSKSDVTLVLVGTGPLEADVRARVHELGLDERVRFAGYRTDVPTILAASDALVIASAREGLNRSVLEAMASGKPVIGTDTRGIADAVRPGAGWIVARNDAKALAAAIDEAAADAAERIRRGAIGRQRVAERFALPLILDAYEEVYREALASRV